MDPPNRAHSVPLANLHTWYQWTHLTDLNICTLGFNGPTQQTPHSMHTWCQWTRPRDTTLYAHLVSMDPPNRPHSVPLANLHTWYQWTQLMDLII